MVTSKVNLPVPPLQPTLLTVTCAIETPLTVSGLLQLRSGPLVVEPEHDRGNHGEVGGVSVAVGVAVLVRVGVAVLVGVLAAVAVGVCVEVLVGVRVGVLVGVAVAVAVLVP